MQPEDKELAGRCAKGDRSAMEELYRKYAACLYALCLRYVSDRDIAKDLTQESFLKIFDSIRKYRPDGSLKAWMIRVTVNYTIDYIRKKKKFDTVSLEKFNENIEEPTSETIQRIPREELMRMVEELPVAKRIVFNLFCIEGYSHKEIGRMLGIKEKTSSSLLFKGKMILAEKVSDYIKHNSL